jgi:hypothetical protein
MTRPIALLAVIVTLVCVVFWIRSFFVQDEVTQWRRHADGTYTVALDLKSCAGEIAISREHALNAPYETYWRGEVMSARKTDLAVTATFLGFAIESYTTQGGHPSPATTLLIPYWLFALSFGAISVWVIVRIVRAAHIDAGAVCSRCRYDLRATPDRCPECGFVPENRREIASDVR